MRKYIYFSLWNFESLEHKLEEFEKSGYRLTKVSFSHWFTFKESSPKQMFYFLTYKSFRGESMEYCDYALESDFCASMIDTKMCYFSLYRTKEEKNRLSLLYGARMDYIRSILLEKALTSLALTIIFTTLFFLSSNISMQGKFSFVLVTFAGICACLTAYYFFGYIKQKIKCKKYEHSRNIDY